MIKGLEEAGHEVVEVRIARDGGWSAAGAAVDARPGGGLLGADVAFPVLHGAFGEDGSLQGLLEMLDLPYVGSDVLSSATCMDKLTLKRLLAGQGIPQVDFVAVGEEGWRERCAELGTPLWVKPSRMGSSVGITRIEDLTALDAAVETALRHDPRVIVEASADGREIECSVLGNEDPRDLDAGGDPRPRRVVRLRGEVRRGRHGPGGPGADLGDRDGAGARARRRVFTLAGCSGLARCDFFVEPDGTVLVNEINTMPGFTETSVYAKLLEAGGLSYPDLCDRLVALAIERHQRARSYEF